MRRVTVLLSAVRAGVAFVLGYAGDRLVPALLTGAGVFLVSAGLWTYVAPLAAAPTAAPTASPVLSTSPTASAATLPPSASASPSGTPGIAGVATRIVVPALGVDLPIVAAPPNEEFPLCGVAEYFTATTASDGTTIARPLAYPGRPQATYLYAHARTGMFLPLLTASQRNGGQALVGMYVEVYTADDRRHVYEISQVLRHQPPTAATLAAPLAATTDQLWLQTSEGPYETSTKLQVVATPIGTLPASSADAAATGKGRVCPDAPICQSSNGSGCRRR